jgi:hypothetical protein
VSRGLGIGLLLAALAGAVFLVAFNFTQRTETQNRNKERDQMQAAHSAEIARDKATIDSALEAICNPATSAETLARVYRTASYPDYFFQALAAHHHTPPEILRDLYHRPRTISGLDIWFAGNPSTPVDVLDEIAKATKETYVVSQLIENPALDCKRLSALGVRLMKQQRDPPDANVMRVTERLSTVCA